MPQVSPSHSVTLRVRYPSRARTLARITGAIADEGAMIRSVSIVGDANGTTTRAIDVDASDEQHECRIAAAVAGVDEVELLGITDRTLDLHVGGKIQVENRVPLDDRDALSRAYTPGVARVCHRVADDLAAAYQLTIKGNMVAVVSDGSAVLGLGNIGPYGALPVMEGKAMLFKQFAGIDAFPICLDTQDTEEIIETVRHLAPVFGGINLEDISAPRCFEIEERLRELLDIPVFHDDQHGTAVVVCAGLLNALKLTGRSLSEVRVAISGAGAAGMAVSNLLLALGVGDLVVCDSVGAIYEGRPKGMNSFKDRLAARSNKVGVTGGLDEAVRGAEVFVGVSQPNVLSVEALQTMAPAPIIFALANPVPEVDPQAARKHAAILATGRSDLPNQINNAVAFPGIFRGLLDVRASGVNEAMLLAAVKALASAVPEDTLAADHIIPSVFQSGLSQVIAKAVSEAARAGGLARDMNTRAHQLICEL
ncbi:MAG: NAD-dependent malic enzyme [Armatimonadetes bacterium]|nr:NAD-dependent malic enzyme [Armatimonadota bacterium]